MAQVAVRTAARDERADSNGDSAPGQSSAFDATQSMHVTHSARNEYPLNVSVDFTQLRTHALRRYMAFHRIPETPGSSREQLAVAVARHFNEDCQRADERAAIASFVSYLKSSKEETPDLAVDGVEPTITRSHLYDGGDGDTFLSSDSDGEPERERDSAYDYYPNDDGEDDDDDRDDDDDGEDKDDAEFQVAPRKRKSSSPKTSKASKSESKSSALKKKRKARVYCVCKGASFGNMIACDSKTCADRSNWYHMGCVGLDPASDPPETWFCPTCDAQDAPLDVPENQYRKPVASVTYGDMISHALTVLPNRKGSFKEICDFVETQYESQLNWKLESDQRKSPVWKSSVRKILFSNMRFRKHPSDKGVFCLAA